MTAPRLGQIESDMDHLFSLVNTFVMVPAGNRVKIKQSLARFRLLPSGLITRG